LSSSFSLIAVTFAMTAACEGCPRSKSGYCSIYMLIVGSYPPAALTEERKFANCAHERKSRNLPCIRLDYRQVPCFRASQ